MLGHLTPPLDSGVLGVSDLYTFDMDTSHTIPKVLGLMSEFLNLGHFIYTLRYLATPLLLPDHVGLPHVLDLAVHLVNFFSWMGQGYHSETLLLLTLFYQSTPSCLKVIGRWGGGGGPCDFRGIPLSKLWTWTRA